MRMSGSRPVRFAAVLLGCVLAAGCTGSLLKSELPVPQTYRLTPLAAESTAAAPFDALLLVGRPVVAPGLDTERIAVLRPDRRLDYFSGSQWGAALPDVVQEAVIESLQNGGRLRGVERDLGSFRPDFVLHIDVRAFQAEYAGDGAPRAHVDLFATLGRLNDRGSVLSFTASATEDAHANSMTAVAEAFDKAQQSATRILLANTMEYISHAEAPRGASPTPPASAR
jgi:ABC-type uncharacterized transport system auxiliary subunit